MRNILTLAIEIALATTIGAMGMLSVACIFSTDAREVFGKIMLTVITLHSQF